MGSVVIVGAGAIGTWLAIRLSHVTDTTVQLLARPERRAAFGADGPTLHVLAEADPEGTGGAVQKAPSLSVVSDPAALPDRPDLVIMAVRAYQTGDAATLLAAQGIEPRAALTLQNGLGNAERIAETFGAARTIAGTTTHGVTYEPPARVIHAGAGDTTLGPWHPDATQHCEHAAHLLKAAGIPTQLVSDPRLAIWRKVAVNTAINPPTAIHRIENGLLLDGAKLQDDLAEAAREAARVARAEGVPLDDDDAARSALDVAARTARNRSSMLQALLAGRALEIDAITGEVVRRATRHGIAVPVNAAHLKALASLTTRTSSQHR